MKALAGTRDILPAEAGIWRRIEETARALFERWGYQEIRTPIFEDTRLFRRGIGETTDIVEKEMYTLETSGKTSLTLRPEATAPVVRAYLEHNLHKTRPFQKVYYIGPFFRHERPQAHRSRQFSQLGVEALGSKDPWLDTETIRLAHYFFEQLGLTDLELRISSMGDGACRPAMRRHLEAEVADRLSDLCRTCKERHKRNVFRVLDCKEEGCRRVVEELTDLTTFLCKDCRSHYETIQASLGSLGIRFRHDPRIVRGLDYYSRTVWEIDDPRLGAQSALGGGGRYDPLLVELGAPDLGGVGFALGTDRTLDALRARGVEEGGGGSPLHVFVIAVEDRARDPAHLLVDRLRREGLCADLDYEGKSVKAQMRQAHRLGALWTAFLGPDEISRGVVRLREMETGEERELQEKEISGRVLQSVREKPQG